MNYEDMAPAADKLLRSDGSVTTMAGEVILPADPYRAGQYEQMSPAAAKWLLPDGSITDKLPITGGGIVPVNGTVPDDSFGSIGNYCITPEGIYIKKMVQLGTGFTLSCDNEDFNGYWRDMGVNTVISSTGGDPEGSRYYQHESEEYFLCWNTAYGGYWWINTHLRYDNGGAAAWNFAPEHTPLPPGSGWSGAVSGNLIWTLVESSAPQPKWELCFDFKTKNGLPHFKTDRLMKYSEGIVNAQGGSGLSVHLYPDGVAGGNTLSMNLNLAGSGSMARIDTNNQLFVGDPLFIHYNPTGATQALALGSYRNFRINLSAAAITLSFSGSVPAGNYPCTIKVWLIPRAASTGTPKHTVTWPSSVHWVGANAHKFIGAEGQPDTPVLAELTTFDNGGTWLGRAYNVLYPLQEVR